MLILSILLVFFVGYLVLVNLKINPEKVEIGRGRLDIYGIDDLTISKRTLQSEYLDCVDHASLNNYPEVLKECNNMLKMHKEICTKTFKEELDSQYLDCVDCASLNNYPEVLKECHMMIKTYEEVCL